MEEDEFLNNDPNYKRQIIIVSSANADELTNELAFNVGVDGFIEKPLHLQEVYNIYYDVINKSEAEISASSSVVI